MSSLFSNRNESLARKSKFLFFSFDVFRRQHFTDRKRDNRSLIVSVSLRPSETKRRARSDRMLDDFSTRTPEIAFKSDRKFSRKFSTNFFSRKILRRAQKTSEPEEKRESSSSFFLFLAFATNRTQLNEKIQFTESLNFAAREKRFSQQKKKTVGTVFVAAIFPSSFRLAKNQREIDVRRENGAFLRSTERNQTKNNSVDLFQSGFFTEKNDEFTRKSLTRRQH